MPKTVSVIATSVSATLVVPAPAATTRATRSVRVPLMRGRRLLVSTQVVASAETRLRYSIERLLGEGGYGQVYLARRLGQSDKVPEAVVIKISPHIDGWLREAYFGQLLQGHPRAIQVYDNFPLVRQDGHFLYCLAMEYASHGDLSAHLQRSGKPWAEKVVRREIAGVLQVLGKLHRGQMLHRDLTPLNVFVCDNRKLKLGDFGIVRQQNDRRGITTRTLNPLMAPSDIVAATAPKWQGRDDVYQVGQLIGMLVKGDASARVRPTEVRALDCSDHLKEIIHRCIGERRKRYESADELIEALCNPPAVLKAGVQKTLKGVHITFTGILSKPRREAQEAARRAGAIVHSGPSVQTTVIVRGRPNPQQAAGRDGGIKLMEIKRLREEGHRITVLNETQFWRLAVARR